MAQQSWIWPPLGPQVPLRDWAQQWLAANYPNQNQLSRDTIREAMWHALPKDYLPSLTELWRSWWMRIFADQIAKPLGLVFTDGRDGSRLDAQLALPFVDLEAYCVGKLRLAKGDIDAVRTLLQECIAYHGWAINVDQTMQQWQQAAGF